jgi:hypothetical protein
MMFGLKVHCVTISLGLGNVVVVKVSYITFSLGLMAMVGLDKIPYFLHVFLNRNGFSFVQRWV